MQISKLSVVIIIVLVSCFALGISFDRAAEPSFTFTRNDTSIAVPISELESEPTQTLININSADSDKLCKLPGIGTTLSERIIVYRNEHGGFSSIEEIMAVKGIGEKKFEALKNLICIN